MKNTNYNHDATSIAKAIDSSIEMIDLMSDLLFCKHLYNDMKVSQIIEFLEDNEDLTIAEKLAVFGGFEQHRTTFALKKANKVINEIKLSDVQHLLSDEE